MGYRKHGPKNDHVLQRTVNDSTTPSRIYINNGSETHIAVPCHYLLGLVPPHNRHWHDYMGWPTPNYPDHCCQLPHNIMPFGWKTAKIDLVGEGYDHGDILWEDEPQGCTTQVRFSSREKNVVEFDISVDSPENLHEPGIYRFAVHIYSGPTTKRRYAQRGSTFEVVEDHFPGRNDIVYLGELVVLPAGYHGQPEPLS